MYQIIIQNLGQCLKPLSRCQTIGRNCGAHFSSTTYAKMNWDEFFKARRRLQLIQRISGVPFIFAFWLAEGAILSLPLFDPTKTILDMDPMVVVGLGTMIGSIASYAIGSGLSVLTWRYFRPNISQQLDQKQKDFYRRISKYRANVPPNPTQMNFNFDFYGEKIRSISDYRNWLRRQRKLITERQFAI